MILRAVLVVFVAIFIRALTGLNGYSGSLILILGKGVPPLFGDFEAQRHWLEITSNLPITEWYTYDSNYWPLDYPPLTAFHSFVLGKIAWVFDPKWVELDKSRGIESVPLEIFMRWTSILTEALIYFPAVFQFAKLSKDSWTHKIAIAILLQPALIVIDHGHFQYNSAMLGFVLWSIVFAYKERYLSSSASFVLALCFKQMALFYSLAIFFYLLGVCYSKGLKGTLLLARIGIVVIVTFGLHLYPFYTDFDSILQIFRRIFPFHRGLFEDKVANFWCTLNLVVKLRERFEISTLAKLSAATTLVSILPSGFQLLASPVPKKLLYGLFTSSLSFFLFSFQVHEKSILLPALPATLLLLHEPELAIWFNNIALFSLYPLLKRDGCALAYWVCLGLWNLYTFNIVKFRKFKLAFVASMSAALLIHILDFTNPPERLPHLWIVMNYSLSFLHFSVFLVYANLKLWKN